jgi:hypothetical protein
MRIAGAHTLLCFAVGCGTPSAPVIPFTDASGRSCNYDSASSANPHVTCDVDPGTLITCTDPAVPAYIIVTSDVPMPALRNCAACRNDHLYDPVNMASCASVECSTAADCPMNGVCTTGVCHRSF